MHYQGGHQVWGWGGRGVVWFGNWGKMQVKFVTWVINQDCHSLTGGGGTSGRGCGDVELLP